MNPETPSTEAIASPNAVAAPSMPDMPAPAREHKWLERFVGEWRSEAEIICQPDQPAITGSGTESARLLGGFWLVAEGKSEMFGAPFANVLTLGFDPERRRYVGTWVDSCTSFLWRYEGAVNAAGDTLSLECNGPCPANPGKLSRFREVTEFKSADHRVFTSSIEQPDGQWRTMVTVNFHRLP